MSKTIVKKLKDDRSLTSYHPLLNYLFSFTKKVKMIPNTKPTNAKFNHAKSAGTGKNLTFASKLSTDGTASLKVEVTVEYKLNNPVNATVHT